MVKINGTYRNTNNTKYMYITLKTPLSRNEASPIRLKLSVWEWRDIRRKMSTSPSCVALQTKPMHDVLPDLTKLQPRLHNNNNNNNNKENRNS